MQVGVPKAQNNPSVVPQYGRDELISSPIAFDLRFPVSNPGLWKSFEIWRSMPKSAIHEYRYTFPREHEIRLA